MQDRYKDNRIYFDELVRSSTEFIFPFIDSNFKVTPDMRVLEIGCGQGGNLVPFIRNNNEVVGVDIEETKVESGNMILKNDFGFKSDALICKNIYELCADDLGGTFDVIFLRDVIEHLPNQKDFLAHLRQFIKPGGIVFFAFPPWQMPFGGHQQVINHKYLSKVPYVHLLPKFLYRKYLQKACKSQKGVDFYMDIRKTGLSIERFESYLKYNKYDIYFRQLYLINPYYKVKFNLKPRKQLPILRNVKWLRNFYTTSAYYIVKLA